MCRDQRIQDNHALLFAQSLSTKLSLPLLVLFPYFTSFDKMAYRQFKFMTDGLRQVEVEAKKHGLPFYVLTTSDPASTILNFSNDNEAAAVVTDFFPLRTVNQWNFDLARGLDALKAPIPLYQVDAHNVVPCWIASDKQEAGARTLRPKINKLYGRYLTQFEKVKVQPADPSFPIPASVDWEKCLSSLDESVDRSVEEVKTIKAGAEGGMANFRDFLATRLKNYADSRNDPNLEVQSQNAMYDRFGQVSFQRLALDIKANKMYSEGTASFVEEGVVRRELSDNFCYYNPNYDDLSGAAGWARDSLELHSDDVRAYTYTLKQFETGNTHDDLWNAAQLQLSREGRMHGFLRMYWAKKILEWTENPAQALEYGQHLNDKFAIDGSCPNSYVGIGWSVMGIHDMGWAERPIFGKIRFMNYNGCKRKFKIKEFVDRYVPAAANAKKLGGQEGDTNEEPKKKKASGGATKKKSVGGDDGGTKKKQKTMNDMFRK
jgi:deoxyribodipyrimidine photo-lyase